MTIYREIILDHYRKPHNFGRLKSPSHSGTLTNPLCGDEITIDVLVHQGKIKDIKFFGKGCAISQASASMLTDFAKGKKILSLRKIDKSVILKKLGIELSPNRLKCALLPLEALQRILIRNNLC